jgi:hypothetical protein
MGRRSILVIHPKTIYAYRSLVSFFSGAAMNWFLFISGILALGAVIGHFTIGKKLFLLPTLKADFDAAAKKTMHCLFHYASVWLILSAAALLLAATGHAFWYESEILIWFIALHYALMAVAQVIIAATAKTEKIFSKLFQWVFFALVAVFAVLGVV